MVKKKFNKKNLWWIIPLVVIIIGIGISQISQNISVGNPCSIGDYSCAGSKVLFCAEVRGSGEWAELREEECGRCKTDGGFFVKNSNIGKLLTDGGYSNVGDLFCYQQQDCYLFQQDCEMVSIIGCVELGGGLNFNTRQECVDYGKELKDEEFGNRNIWIIYRSSEKADYGCIKVIASSSLVRDKNMFEVNLLDGILFEGKQECESSLSLLTTTTQDTGNSETTKESSIAPVIITISIAVIIVLVAISIFIAIRNKKGRRG